MSTRNAALALFGILLFAYSYSHSGTGWNPNARLNLIYSIVDRGTLNIDAYHENTGDKSYFNGHYYSDKAPGIAFLGLPAFTFAKLIGYVWDWPNDWNNRSWITTAGSVGVMAAIGGACLFLLLCQLIDRRNAFVAAFALFLGAAPYPYATFLFSHAGTVGFLAVALWFALRNDGAPRRNMVFCGAACAAAILCEYTAASAAAAIVLLAVHREYRRAIPLALGAAPVLLVIPLYSVLTYGSLFSISYSHVTWPQMHQGVFGLSLFPDIDIMGRLLFSRARGLFYWTPFLLLVFPGFVFLWKRSPVQCAVIAITCLLHVAAISSYHAWDGGGSLGPRHLAVLLPLLAIPAALGLQRFPRIGTALAVLSVLMTGSATLVNPGLLSTRSPLFDYYIPSLIEGESNLTMVQELFGLRGPVAVAILFLLVFQAAGLVIRKLRDMPTRQHKTLKARTYTFLQWDIFRALFAYFSRYRHGKNILLCLGVFLLSVGCNAIAATLADVSALSVSSYIREDSGHYLAIAERGYEFFRCAEVGGYAPDAGCGNAGWFPGYPVLFKTISMVSSLSLENAAFLVANVSWLLCLFTLWLLYFRNDRSFNAIVSISLAAVFPGAIYFHAVYPLSIFMLLALVQVWAVAEGKWKRAIAAGSFAAFTYPPGWLLGIVSAPAVFVRSKGSILPRFERTMLVFGMILAGTLCAFLVHIFHTSVWNAFVQVQVKYGVGDGRNPFRYLANVFTNVFKPEAGVVQWQELLIVIILLLAVAVLILHRKKITFLEWLIAGQVFLFWITPILLGGVLSLFRAHSMLLPVIVLLRRLPIYLLASLVAIAALIRIFLSVEFFQGNLL